MNREKTFQSQDVQREASEERTPKITFYFDAHATEKNAREMKRFIQNADTVVLEGEFANSPLIQDIVSGEKTLENLHIQGPFSPFAKEILGQIEGTGKRVVGISINNEDEGFPEYEKFAKEYTDAIVFALGSFYDGDFESAVEQRKEAALAEKNAQTIRETIIKKKIVNLLSEADKEAHDVFVQLGGAHSMLFHGIDTGAHEKKRVFSKLPYTFNQSDEIFRRLMANKEVPDDLYVQALVGNAIELFLSSKTEDTQWTTEASRKLASTFDYASAIRFSEALGKRGFLEVSEEQGIDIINEAYKDVMGSPLSDHVNALLD